MSDLSSLIASLKTENITLSLAESCTGGLISSMIVDHPDVSEIFLGSVVAYSDGSKIDLLGVNETTLERYGPVSAETAKEMAEGSRCFFGSDISASVTGFAGPSGTDVGLVYIAVSTDDATVVKEFRFDGSRETVRKKAADAVITAILEEL